MAVAREQLSEEFLLVAAIDFGTMYSGFAFSTKDEFKKHPDVIKTCEDLTRGYNLSSKIPTCLLLDKDGKYINFGYEAEDEYNNYVMSGEEKDYHFFHRFKMRLHTDGELSQELQIPDVSDNLFPAMVVFSLSIKALKDSLLGSLKTHGYQMLEKDIRWVLTVPAIWTEPSKQFMRDAANKAGIPKNQLKIALEPEAASVYCQYLPIEKLSGAEKGFTVTKKGTKYMVVDLGGGTADITLHEKMDEGKLKELDKASGGAAGGTAVDDQFFNMLSDIIGQDLLSTMKKSQKAAYIDFCREFETAKRRVKPEVENKVNLGVLYHLNEFCTKTIKKDFPGALKVSAYGKTMTTFADKIRIDSVIIREMFRPVISQILSYINSVLKEKTAKGIDVVLLVDGFSESLIVQDAIRKEYPTLRVVVPFDASLAVVKGAVIFGHLPNTIESRVMKYSYCVKYPHEEKWVFKTLVNAGQSVDLTHYEQISFSTTLKVFPINIYYSTRQSPSSEEDCWLFAKMEFPIKGVQKGQSRMLVQFVFGDTELAVNAIDMSSMKPYGASIKLK